MEKSGVFMSVLSELKKRLIGRLCASASSSGRQLERQLILQSLFIAKLNRGLAHMGTLSEAEFCGFSQWGEDGIIDWLVSRIPELPKTFVEFGVENYIESNTRLLLQMHNFKGLVLDASDNNVNSISSSGLAWRYNLSAKCDFINVSNINSLISLSGFEDDIGLLSIDLDGNDYWVWEAIVVVKPGIVVIEYNAVFGDLHHVTVPYRADFQRTKAHYSNLYFGSSLLALISLGCKKGYTFIGTTSSGVNAFFVRNDLTPDVLSNIKSINAYPSLIRESRDSDGKLTYLSGLARCKLIIDCSLWNLDTLDTTSIRKLGAIYSPEWKASARRAF